MKSSSISIQEVKHDLPRKPRGSTIVKSFKLYVDDCHRATVEQCKNGKVKMRFNPVGAFNWVEAKVWLQGLLDLSIHAEELDNENS